MGQDKTGIMFRGFTLLQQASTLFESLEMEYYLSVNARQQELKKLYACIEDELEDVGPLGGILSALKKLSSNLLIIPVDMPLLRAGLLQSLLEEREIHELVRCFRVHGRTEPFPSLWNANAIEPLEALIREGQLSVQQAISRLPHQIIDCHRPEMFSNMNRPEDLSE